MSQIRYTYIFLIITFLIVSCRHHSPAWNDMDSAESVMENLPDSALVILEGIESERLSSREERARYALLMSMALDKNYVDTTTFDVLQPAIDYYLGKGKGDANDKLQTHYYRGRIYQNQGDNSHAMTSFIRASETGGITDTLTLARTHVAMSVLYYNAYAPKEMTEHALSAANLYNELGLADLQMTCYLRALGGSILSDNKILADSVLHICKPLITKCPEYACRMDIEHLIYLINYGTDSELREKLYSFDANNLSNDAKIEMARGYLKLNQPKTSLYYINALDSTNEEEISLHELIIKSDVYQANNLFKDALDTFKDYYAIMDDAMVNRASYELSFVNEQHLNEIESLNNIRKRDHTIFMNVSLLLVLAIIVSMLYYRHNLAKAKITIIEKDNLQLKMQQDLLLKTNENLELQKKNAELERDSHILALDNLKKEKTQLEMEKRNAELEKERQLRIAENKELQISQITDEIESLRHVLVQRNSITKPIENAVKERIGMLNSLIASAISDNSKYATAYEGWKNDVLKDYEKFMDSTRLAFKASHPKLIDHLEKHNLTTYEINYACLYALGLNGKEVGKYIHCQRHYHISSDIRKKLGLDINNTNLSSYIKKLREQEDSK